MKSTRCSQLKQLMPTETPVIRGCDLCGSTFAVLGVGILGVRPVTPCAYLNHPSVAARYPGLLGVLPPPSTADTLT